MFEIYSRKLSNKLKGLACLRNYTSVAIYVKHALSSIKISKRLYLGTWMSCIYSGLPLCIDTEDLTTRPSMSTTSVQSVTRAGQLISGASSIHYVFFLKWYWIFYFNLQFIGSWQMLYVFMHFQYHCVSKAAYFLCS